MVVLLAHLTSQSIEISLVRIIKGEKTKVFLSQFLPLHNDLSSYIRDANASLSKTKERIDKVVCIFGPTFGKQKIKIIPHSENAPIKIDKALIDKLIASDKIGFDIENEILSVKMNGYKTLNPIGKEASELQIAIYQSSVPEEIINELNNSILHISKKTSFHTFLYVAYKIISSIRQNDRPFLLIEIERDVTNLSLMNGNSFIETASAGIGFGFIQSSIQQELNVDEKVARSILRMMEEKTLDDNTKSKLEKVIDESMKKWSEEANKGMSQLGGGIPLPGEIYLMSPNTWCNYFSENLKKNGYGNFSNVYDFKSMNQSVSFETALENPLLSFIDVLFIEKYLI